MSASSAISPRANARDDADAGAAASTTSRIVSSTDARGPTSANAAWCDASCATAAVRAWRSNARQPRPRPGRRSAETTPQRRRISNRFACQRCVSTDALERGRLGASRALRTSSRARHQCTRTCFVSTVNAKAYAAAPSADGSRPRASSVLRRFALGRRLRASLYGRWLVARRRRWRGRLAAPRLPRARAFEVRPRGQPSARGRVEERGETTNGEVGGTGRDDDRKPRASRSAGFGSGRVGGLSARASLGPKRAGVTPRVRLSPSC